MADSRQTISDAHLGYRFEVVQNTLIAIWWLKPEIANLVALVHRLRTLHDNHPKGIFLYNVITATTEIPEPAAREALRDHFSSMRGKLVAAALVVERPGIQGSLSRAVLTTIYTLSRSPFSMKIFSSRPAAAEWLAQHPTAVPADVVLTRIQAMSKSAR
ncbi:MAG: hypothetical protein WDO69_11790 [Pseudomonadota bacterium]